MRFTSLIVELIRARPQLMVWLTTLGQALLWLLVAAVFYRSPPGNLATVLAYGREYRVGSEFGPPLAFWLSDIAFRAAGYHAIGIYVLSQLCLVVGLWTLFQLGRLIVGSQHAVLATLLTQTIFAFGWPNLEFGPSVVAFPLWALVLWHAWQIIGQGRRNAWFVLSIEAGLLLLTTSAAPLLLLLLAAFAVASARGRQALLSRDALFSCLVIAALALPYFIWLWRAPAYAPFHWPSLAEIGAHAIRGGKVLAILLALTLPVAVLSGMNLKRFGNDREDPAVIYRGPVDPLARQFVFFFALVPAIFGALGAMLLDLDQVSGGPAVVLLMAGLAVILAAGDLISLHRQQYLRTAWMLAIALPAALIGLHGLAMPWMGAEEVGTSWPAGAMARYFADAFERSVGKPLPAIAGETRLATLIAMSRARPHVLSDGPQARMLWMTPAGLSDSGGIVVWRVTETAAAPPPAEITERFPGLVPETPRTFDRLISGREPPLRVGWAIIRPKAP